MEEQEIKKGKLLIREFMKVPAYSMVMPYDGCWDFLMPVVERIEKLNDAVVDKVYLTINGNTCNVLNYINPKEILRSKKESSTYKIKKVADTKIAATFEAVVDFLKWYIPKAKKNGI